MVGLVTYNFVSSSDVPCSEVNIFVADGLNIKSCVGLNNEPLIKQGALTKGGNSCDNFPKFHPVQCGSLSGLMK